MTQEAINTSNELIRWLKLLALPAWIRLVLALIMAMILCSALGLLFWSLLRGERQVATSTIGALTVGLPVGLVVVALVFGDGGARKLKALTQQVLRKEVPDAILENLSADDAAPHYTRAHVRSQIRGCVADYVLTVTDAHASGAAQPRERQLEFKLELNVRKVNFVVWLADAPGCAADSPAQLSRYRSCFFGAAKEGYIQNQEPLRGERKHHTGIVFIKMLDEDFLLNPAARLYFSQDLAFFIRGLLDAEGKA